MFNQCWYFKQHKIWRVWIKKPKHYFLCTLSLLFIYFLNDTSYFYDDFKELATWQYVKISFAYTHLEYLLFYCSRFWIYFAFWLYYCWRPNSNSYHFSGVYIFIEASPLKIWFRPCIRFKPHTGNKDWLVCSLMLWFYVLISRRLQVLAVSQFSNKMRSFRCILCFSLTNNICLCT